MNSKEEDFCHNYVQEFGLRMYLLFTLFRIIFVLRKILAGFLLIQVSVLVVCYCVRTHNLCKITNYVCTTVPYINS